MSLFAPTEPKRKKDGSASAGGGPAKKTKVTITKEKAIIDINHDWKIVKQERSSDLLYREWLKDKSVVMKVVAKSYAMLKYLPDFQDDPDVVIEAICGQQKYPMRIPFTDQTRMADHLPHASAFQFASERLRHDVDFNKRLRAELGKSAFAPDLLPQLDKYTPDEILLQLKPFSKEHMYAAVEAGNVIEFKRQLAKIRNPNAIKMIKKLCGMAAPTQGHLDILFELLQMNRNKPYQVIADWAVRQLLSDRGDLFDRVLTICMNVSIIRSSEYARAVAKHLAESLRRAMMRSDSRQEGLLWSKCEALTAQYGRGVAMVEAMIKASDPNRVQKRLDFGSAGGGSSSSASSRPVIAFEVGKTYGNASLKFKVIEREPTRARILSDGMVVQITIGRWIGSTITETIEFDGEEITANEVISDSTGAAASSSSSSSSSNAAAAGSWHFANGVLTVNANVYASQFKGKTNITKVIIKEGVTTIKDYAFAECSSLTSVTLPAGLQTIGGHAFAWCTGLTSLTFPDGLQTIEESAFYGCSSLTSVTFPDALKTIGDYAFAECRSLASATFPASVQTIGGWAFARCRSLASVTLPAGLQTIGDDAFYECISLAEIKIPQSLDTSTVSGWSEVPSSANVIVTLEISDSETEDEDEDGPSSAEAVLLPKIKEIFTLMQRLNRPFTPAEVAHLLSVAVEKNTIDIVRFLCPMSGPLTGDLMANAVVKNNLDMLRLLLDCSSRQSDRSFLRRALSTAVRNINGIMVTLLLDAGAPPGGDTMRFAVQRSDLQFVRQLLEERHGIDATQVDEDGNTFMHFLGTTGPIQEICALLKDAGCPMNGKNSLGKTPLESAENSMARQTIIEAGGGGKLTLKQFRKLKVADMEFPATLNTPEKYFMMTDDTESPVRCLPCKHVYNADFIQHWLKENDANLTWEDGVNMGFEDRLKSECPECKQKIEMVEVFSPETAAIWNDFNEQANAVAQKKEADIEKLKDNPQYRQWTVKAGAAAKRKEEIDQQAQAREEAFKEQMRLAQQAFEEERQRFRDSAAAAKKEADDALEEADKSIDEERARIRAAADAKEKALRDKRLSDSMLRLTF